MGDRREMPHIIAIQILEKGKLIASDLVDKLDRLKIRCMINAVLQNAASMMVSSDLDIVGSHSIVNELLNGNVPVMSMEKK